MENLTRPAPAFTEFKFKDIGRPPVLLHRFTSAHPGEIEPEPSPSPSPPPEEHSGASSPSGSILRPTLMQVLGTGLNDADVAGAAASTSGDTISGHTLRPSSGIVSSTTPSITTLSVGNALLDASEWQLRYPSSEPPKSDPYSHPSSTPLLDAVIKVAPTAPADLPLQGEHSLETLIKLKDQLLSSLASYTPSNPSAAFSLAKASREQSSAALDAAQRAHTLAQQSLNSVQECANVAQEALRTAERAHSLAEDTTAAIDKIKTDNEPWTVIQEAVRAELASLTQWIEAEEKSRLLAETRRLANSARDLRMGTDAWGDNPQPDRATQRSRGSVTDFRPMPDSDIVMGSPDDLRHNVPLPHGQVDNTPAPDDDLRRRQNIQRRLDEATIEAKRLEDEARDLALRKDEEERLKRVMDIELAARRAREVEEAEIRQARQQREKEKKQQAEEAEAQRAAQENERREAEEALANRSREVERRRALELKRYQDLLDEQKKQREEVQRAKAQYSRVQAARIQAERAKGSSIENASNSFAPPTSIKPAIPQSNEFPHPSALEAVSTNTTTSVPTIPSSHPQVSSSMSLSSLPAHPPTSLLGPASTQIGSVGVQTRVEAAIPVQAPQQLSQKGTCRALSGDVKLGPTFTPNTDASPSIRAASLGLRSHVAEKSPISSTLQTVDIAKVARATSQPDPKVLSSPFDIISPCTSNFESQKHLSTDKHSLPPIDHFPQSHLSTPESEPMAPYSSFDNGNLPTIKMEETDELLHVQEANLRHIRERSRIKVSQMAKTEADRQSLNTVPQPPKGIHSTSPVPSPVHHILPPTTLPPAGPVQTSNIPALQKNTVQISAKPSQSTSAAATGSPASSRKPKKAKASKVPPASQKTSQPSQGNPNASPNKQPQTSPKAPLSSVNQKAVPTKQQVQVHIEPVSRPVLHAPPASKPPVQKKTPTKPRSGSPPTSQVDHGRAIYSQSSYQSGPSTSRVTEPRGPSPMGPEGFPSESGWYNARPVDEDIAHERRSYDSDGYPSSSNRRSRYSPPQDYSKALSSRSYDKCYDYYSPSPSPVPRGRPMSPIARSPSPTLGTKRRWQEEPAFIPSRRQRQEDSDSYSRESISAARDIPSRPQTPPATWNRKISPPPTLVSRLDINYARKNLAADSDYSAAPARPSTRSYKASDRPDSPPRVGGSKNNLLGRLSNVSGKPPPSQQLRGRRGRGGGNSRPHLAARLGDTGINDSY